MGKHLKIVDRPIDTINPAPYNPRDITDHALAGLVESIRQFGLVDPLIVNKRNGVLVGGHQRLKAAELLGFKTVPTVEVDLDEVREKALNVTLNNTKIGGFFTDDLQEILEELRTELPDDEFAGLHLEELELEELEDPFEEKPADEAADQLPENVETICKPGDLWLLGEHRLLCGDATNIQQVERLLGECKADMVFTDPPYGISVVSKDGSLGGGTKGKYRPVIGDENTNAAVDAYNLCLGLKIPVLFFWGANHYSSALPDSPCWVVWDKQGGKRVTFADCELCYTNLEQPARLFTHIWDGFRRDSEKGEKRIHPTQKPVQLFIDIWEKFDCPKTVLDLFGGSGSTLIAAEKTGRQSFLMELDPYYCDLIIQRWSQYTGKKAQRLS